MVLMQTDYDAVIQHSGGFLKHVVISVIDKVNITELHHLLHHEYEGVQKSVGEDGRNYCQFLSSHYPTPKSPIMENYCTED